MNVMQIKNIQKRYKMTSFVTTQLDCGNWRSGRLAIGLVFIAFKTIVSYFTGQIKRCYLVS